MKKHLVISGIVIAIALFFSTAKGLCEPYKGKAFPIDLINKKLLAERYTYLGKVKEGEGKFKIYYSVTDSRGRLILGSTEIIQTDTDLWLYLAPGAQEILQK